jgi:hypothetical protein
MRALVGLTKVIVDLFVHSSRDARKSFFNQGIELGGENVGEALVHISMGLFLALNEVFLQGFEGGDAGVEGFLLDLHKSLQFVNMSGDSRSKSARHSSSRAGRRSFRVLGGAAMPGIPRWGLKGSMVVKVVIRA